MDLNVPEVQQDEISVECKIFDDGSDFSDREGSQRLSSTHL